jgi:hypothetical protein
MCISKFSPEESHYPNIVWKVTDKEDQSEPQYDFGTLQASSCLQHGMMLHHLTWHAACTYCHVTCCTGVAVSNNYERNNAKCKEMKSNHVSKKHFIVF